MRELRLQPTCLPYATPAGSPAPSAHFPPNTAYDIPAGPWHHTPCQGSSRGTMTGQLAAATWNRTQAWCPPRQEKSAGLFPTFNSHRMGNLAPLEALFFFPIWQLANSFRNYFRERKTHLTSSADRQRERAFDLHLIMSEIQDKMSLGVKPT